MSFGPFGPGEAPVRSCGELFLAAVDVVYTLYQSFDRSFRLRRARRCGYGCDVVFGQPVLVLARLLDGEVLAGGDVSSA